jgi:HD-GYP domain-containing protein (c-di-GMP phosphodiesterase class II)
MTVDAAIERWIDPGPEDPAFGELLLAQLARTTRFRDEETAAHMQRMSESCAAIARRLSFSEPHCERLRAAAQVHDVGKLGIPDAVCGSRGRSRRRSAARCSGTPSTVTRSCRGSGSELVELAATIALTHHERPDGTGYPNGLKGDQIPLPGRIAAVADVFDALTSDRVYRPAFTAGQAIGIMLAGRGTHFDPAVLDAFLDAGAEIEEIGRRLPDEPPSGHRRRRDRIQVA